MKRETTKGKNSNDKNKEIWNKDDFEKKGGGGGGGGWEEKNNNNIYI